MWSLSPKCPTNYGQNKNKNNSELVHKGRVHINILFYSFIGPLGIIYDGEIVETGRFSKNPGEIRSDLKKKSGQNSSIQRKKSFNFIPKKFEHCGSFTRKLDPRFVPTVLFQQLVLFFLSKLWKFFFYKRVRCRR